MRNILKWLDNNILSILAGFLLVFIPLYPKLPFMDVLPGYIVRVRLEDFAVLFTFLLWIVMLFRGKVKLKENPLYKPIVAYLAIGVVSILSAIFLIKTVPMEKIHVQKILLHFFRRIEYFSLFFIFFSSIKNLKLIKIYLTLFIITVVSVSIYGFGQKYLYWPAFSTMNREFAKGWMLYLTKHARVISTFAGHYDLAAFIMMALVLMWSIFFSLKKWFLKLLVIIVLAAAFWTLILTASRTSFLAYLAGLGFMFFLYAYKKGLLWAISRWFAVSMLSIIIMLSFGDLSDRFTKLLKIDQRVANIKSLLLSPIGAPPKNKAVFLENTSDSQLAQITSKSDQPPSRKRPTDVYEDIPLLIPSTGSATITAVKRTYSQTAFRFDLSTAIRFDALWPMAIKGFKRNPLVGSGYSTLNKIQEQDFTEAESTDNDYLRSLGETGLLGFLTFFGTLAFILYYIWRNINLIKDPVLSSIAIGLGGLLFGLLVNAGYIDVFESSKVAFTFWAMTGFTLGSINIAVSKEKKKAPLPSIPGLANFRKKAAHKFISFIKSDKSKLLLVLIIAFALRMYKINTPLADWHSWRQADTSMVTRNFVKNGINVLYPTFDDLSNVPSGMNNPKGYRFVEFPLYNIASVLVDKIFVGRNIEYSGRLTSIFASLFATIFLYLISKKYLGSKAALLASLFFAILPFNIFYNRVILPEPFLLFASTGMIYFFDRLAEKISNIRHQMPNVKTAIKLTVLFAVSLLFTISAVLVKPYAAFLFLPMTYLWLKQLGFSIKSLIGLLAFLSFALLPFFCWRNWMSQFPEGIPANMWLLNGDGIRFKGAFFYWIFADRLSRLILGYFGISLFLLGFLHKKKKEGWFFYLWALSMLLYVVVFATGNVRHDYYQVLTVPIITIFLAKGVLVLFEIAKNLTQKITVFVLVSVIAIFSLMFGWYHIRDFYNINHPEIVEAGREVDRKVEADALVIAPYNGDTAFLYQTSRSGWPVMQESVDEMIKMGAHYFVSVNFDDLTKELIKTAKELDPEKKRFKIIELTDKYTIIQLVPDKKLPK